MEITAQKTMIFLEALGALGHPWRLFRTFMNGHLRLVIFLPRQKLCRGHLLKLNDITTPAVATIYTVAESCMSVIPQGNYVAQFRITIPLDTELYDKLLRIHGDCDAEYTLPEVLRYLHNGERT